MDLLIETGDTIEVIDFKTSRSKWSDLQAETAADQLLLYHELVKSLVPGKSIRCRFVVITKTKVPSIDVHSVDVDPARIKRLHMIVQRTWDAIQAQHHYPNPSPLNCSGCPFRQECRAWPG